MAELAMKMREARENSDRPITEAIRTPIHQTKTKTREQVMGKHRHMLYNLKYAKDPRPINVEALEADEFLLLPPDQKEAVREWARYCRQDLLETWPAHTPDREALEYVETTWKESEDEHEHWFQRIPGLLWTLSGEEAGSKQKALRRLAHESLAALVFMKEQAEQKEQAEIHKLVQELATLRNGIASSARSDEVNLTRLCDAVTRLSSSVEALRDIVGGLSHDVKPVPVKRKADDELTYRTRSGTAKSRKH